jgi:large subunit ribosomal protein LP0
VLSKRKSHLVIGKNTLLKKVLATRTAALETNFEYFDKLERFGGPMP